METFSTRSPMAETINDEELWKRAEVLYKRSRTGLQRHIKFTDIPDVEKHEWFRKAQREFWGGLHF
jgi:hypothetical protein